MGFRPLERAAILTGGGLLSWYFLDAILQPFYCGFNLSSDQLSALHLTQSFAFLHGYKYPSLGTGIFLTPIYGPVGFCFYWPAAFFSLPSSAMLAGQLIATACFLAPVFWILVKKNRSCGFNANLLAFLVFGLLACTRLEFKYCAFGIHVDAPALGLAAAAACLLYDSKMGRWRLIFSALCAVLSAWSKQTMIPVAAALVLYVWMVQGKRAAFRYMLALLLSGIFVTLAVVYFFGARDLWLNMVTVPSHHPWASTQKLNMARVPFSHPDATTDRWDSVASVLKELLRSIWIPCAMLLLALCADIKEGNFKRGISQWLASNTWVVFALVGIFLLPSAFLGRVKVGGEVNNFGLSLYFWFISALLAVLRKRGAVPLLCALMALAVFQNEAVLRRNPIAPNESRFVTDAAWRFLRKHPEEAYFPGIPLASMMAEKRAYHSPIGIWEREASGIQVPSTQFGAGLPAKMKWIVIGPSYGYMPVLLVFMRRFRDFSITEIPELPGWIAFTKNHA